MKIEKNTVASLAYQVRTLDGVLVDEATVAAPLEYLHGAGNLIKGLEESLAGRQVGDKFDIQVEASNAYGDYNDNLVQKVPRDVFVGVDEIEVGMRFLADTDQGPVPVEITDIDGDSVTVDGNHMLAGQSLKFNVEVISIRAATEDEIAHGHIHGEDGHHHGHEGCGCDEHGENGSEKSGCCGGGGGGCGCSH